MASRLSAVQTLNNRLHYIKSRFPLTLFRIPAAIGRNAAEGMFSTGGGAAVDQPARGGAVLSRKINSTGSTVSFGASPCGASISPIMILAAI